MKFRPCIDIHNGKVKQIIGGSLTDFDNQAEENYVSEQDAAFYANLYKQQKLKGGHIILLNAAGTPYYKQDCEQAQKALSAYQGGLQIGGGITNENAEYFLNMGASHVIVTSYVFQDGRIHYENMNKLSTSIGKENLVLDVSCRKKNGSYYIVTNRWQTFTEEIISEQLLDDLSAYCHEFLIHAVDVEGKASGIETELVELLGTWGKYPVTYAGGVGSLNDLELLRQLGRNKLDVTIGSALDLFGGKISYQDVLQKCDRL